MKIDWENLGAILNSVDKPSSNFEVQEIPETPESPINEVNNFNSKSQVNLVESGPSEVMYNPTPISSEICDFPEYNPTPISLDEEKFVIPSRCKKDLYIPTPIDTLKCLYRPKPSYFSGICEFKPMFISTPEKSKINKYVTYS